MDNMHLYVAAIVGSFILQDVNFCYGQESVFNINDYNYTLHLQQLSWAGAHHDCNRTGGHLVSVTDTEINRQVIQVLSNLNIQKDIWIGGHRTEYQWAWIDGRLVISPGEGFVPYVQGKTIKRYMCGYVITYREGGMKPWRTMVLDNITCSTPLPYMCNSKLYGNEESGVSPKSWDEAKRDCEARSMQLAIFPELESGDATTRYESLKTHINSQPPLEKFWIGVHNLEWQWKNGKYITFANGSELRRESDKNKTCLSANKSGIWKPEDCSKQLQYMCRKYAPVIYYQWNYMLILGVGIGAAVLLIFVVIVLGICLCKMKRKDKSLQSQNTSVNNTNGINTNNLSIELSQNEYSTIPDISASSSGLNTEVPLTDGPVYSQPDLSKKKNRSSRQNGNTR